MENRKGITKLVLALALICIVLAVGFIAVFANFAQLVDSKDSIIRDKDSEIETLTDQMSQLQNWLDGNKSLNDAIINVTGNTNANVTNWPPAFKIQWLYHIYNTAWSEDHFPGAPIIPEEIYVEGYREMFVIFDVKAFDVVASGTAVANLTLDGVAWYCRSEDGQHGTDTYSEWFDRYMNYAYIKRDPGSGGTFSSQMQAVTPIETKGTHAKLSLYLETNATSGFLMFTLAVYLRNQ